jgi:hypothetical protein
MPGRLSKLTWVIMFSKNPDSSVQEMGRSTMGMRKGISEPMFSTGLSSITSVRAPPVEVVHATYGPRQPNCQGSFETNERAACDFGQHCPYSERDSGVRGRISFVPSYSLSQTASDAKSYSISGYVRRLLGVRDQLCGPRAGCYSDMPLGAQWRALTRNPISRREDGQGAPLEPRQGLWSTLPEPSLAATGPDSCFAPTLERHDTM